MKRNLLWLILGLTFLGSLACVTTRMPTEKPESTTESSLEALPPPLAVVEFPEDAKPYPSDWPADLHFPETFKPVDFIQGTMPGGSKPGWSFKTRFDGTIQNAANDLRVFLEERKWQVVDETDLDTGGKLWIIQREGNGSGIIIIDAQEPGRIVIIANFYL